jgi:23S rRNA (cytosine1962-C5)-methyltransferase
VNPPNPIVAAELAKAVAVRKSINAWADSQTFRLFHGPGESEHSELNQIAIDVFQNHYWITEWMRLSDSTLKEIVTFLQNQMGIHAAKSIVRMDRTQVASQSTVETIFGHPPDSRFAVTEFDIPYLIQFKDTKHPGLFLDHAPLRNWLLQTQKNKKVLNLFAYTGSLSVAAGKAGATDVTTIDLSKATIEWAKENWIHAGLPEQDGLFYYGDVFEWLPRLKKKGLIYDTILCDPPSFSRSKSGTFSTSKDLPHLHALIFRLLKPGGTLVTSINSEKITSAQFLKDIQSGADQSGGHRFQVIEEIHLPPTFPVSAHHPEQDYLKGFYIKLI